MKSNLGKNKGKEGFAKNPQNINRKGRPKGFKGLTATLKDVMASDGTMRIENIIELEVEEFDNFGKPLKFKETGKIIKYGKVKIPKGEMIILAATKKAMKGDMRAVEYITDRLEGKAKQQIDFEDLTPRKIKGITFIDVDDE